MARRSARAAALLLIASAAPAWAGAPAISQPPVKQPAVTQPAVTQPNVTGMAEQACPDITGLNFASPYVRQFDWAFLCRYREEDRAWGAAHPAGVVFIGDSITEGWLRGDPALFAPGTLDRGISGQTSPQVLLRFMQDVVALHPRVVHIMVGTNDIAGNSGPTTAQAWKDNIAAMTALARANHIRVVLGSILPSDHFGWQPALQPAARIAELNAWLREFTAANGLVYADYHAALAGTHGELRPELGPDGVHPNAAGYAIMRPIAQAAIAAAERKAE